MTSACNDFFTGRCFFIYKMVVYLQTVTNITIHYI